MIYHRTSRLSLDPGSGLLDGVRQVPSPNCDERPADCQVDTIVIHAISLPPEEFGGPDIERLFCNALDPEAHPYFAGIAGLQVSAHLLIRRDGEIVQFVPLHLRAWHAGESSCEGRPQVNDFSIGIELEGSDHQPFTDRQYQQLGELTRVIREHYPAITPQRIVGHADVAPGRKTDPGPYFDWPRYRALNA
jgi:AmpD protein